MVEDIIAGLSRLRWLTVIAHNSTYTYKDKSPDIREVAADLGVRYVLEGSVRKAGDRLRVTSQLIDASSGAHVWAERYDRPATDVFAVQDEITENVVASIEPHLYAAENRRFQSKPPESIDAWGYVMRAMPQIWARGEKEIETALDDLKRAIAIKPDYARAHSLLAWAYTTGAHMGWIPYSAVFGLALEAARHSVELDGDDPWGHLALGYVHMLSRRSREAIDELDEALWLNPNFALGYMVIGAAHGFAGTGDEGLRHLAKALRLSPRDPHQTLLSIRLCALPLRGRALPGKCRPEPPRGATSTAVHVCVAIACSSRWPCWRHRDRCRCTCRSQTSSARALRRLGRGELSACSPRGPSHLYRGTSQGRSSMRRRVLSTSCSRPIDKALST